MKEKEPGNVLIVDDDPIVRDVLSEILTRVICYHTEIACDGLDGLDKFRNGTYDIVFTDLKMPKMGGMDFLKEVKKINPAQPVVVITGFATVDSAISAMREGANDYITKPFKIDKVKSVTDRILSEKRLLREITESGNERSVVSQLNNELLRKLQEISLIQSITNELDGITDNKDLYERIVEMAMKLLMVKESSFGIVENGYLKILHAVGVKETAISIGSTIFERVVNNKRHSIGVFGESNPYTGKPLNTQFLSIPFYIRDEVFGILNFSSKVDETSFSDSDIALALTFARKASLRIENNALYEVFYSNLVNTLRSLVLSIEARDSYTKAHSERVTKFALQIADMMTLSDDDKDTISFGGYLHDIGKIGVRDVVLLKPGKLTSEEMDEIRLHPIIGDDIIKPIRVFPRERELIRHHHERFDGNGYPDRLTGEAIPLIARVLSVADTYDAITSSRPYRNPLPHEFAIDEIRKNMGTQFDPEVAQAFFRTPAGQKGEK